MKFNVYDFDGTIYDGDSGVDLFLYGLKKYPRHILHIPVIIWYGILYLLKIKTKIDFKEQIFYYFRYVKDMDKYIDDFWKTHEHKIKDFWKEKKSHKNDIISSASGEFWLRPIADKYKVYDLFGTNYDPHTGNILGNNCHGKEKIKLFYEKYPKGKIIEGYTDSKADLPLMEEAEIGYLVKKNRIYKYFEYTKKNFIIRFWNWGWGIYHKNEEIWNYLIVGGLTTVVSIGTKWGLLFTCLDAEVALELQISVILSWIAAVLFAYVANRLFVFKSKNKKLKEFISFVTSRIATLLMEMAIMWFFVTFLKLNTNTWVVIWTIVVQVIVTVANYIFSKLFVFKRK